MKVLIVNDDGINSIGIAAIAKALKSDFELLLVAPDTQKSGVSSAFTHKSPLKIEKAVIEGLEDIESYSVTGTPVDCVKVALSILKFKPDIVVSGINTGANVGNDIRHSGTIGGATEGAVSGIPSVAVSIHMRNDYYYIDVAAEWGARAVKYFANEIKTTGKAPCMLLNVNVPDIEMSQIKGMKVVPSQITSELTDYTQIGDNEWIMSQWRIPDTDADDDANAIKGDYVSLTPISIETCDYSSLDKIDTEKI